MNVLLTEHISKIEELERYLRLTAQLRDDVLSHQDIATMINDKMVVFFHSTVSRKYNYNMTIIRLYGILESYLEECIVTYLKKLSKIVIEYKRLPQQIQDNHLSLSADLLKYIEKGYDKYSDISKEDVILRLGDCINNKANYKLNTAAFIHHNSNFRHEMIRELYAHVGIDNITLRIAKHRFMKEYFINIEGEDEAKYDQHTIEGYYSKLEELVRRRNMIAHGNEADDLLSSDIILDYTAYIRAIILSINDIVDRELKRFYHEVTRQKELGAVVDVFGNHIIGVKSNHVEFCVGSKIWAVDGNGKFVDSGEIISIEHNHEPVSCLLEEQDLLLGIKVNMFAKSNYRYGVYID